MCTNYEGSSHRISSWNKLKIELAHIRLVEVQVAHLWVLLLRKKPSSLSDWSRINWLSDAKSLNTVLTPCLTSKAGTIEEGCSDIREISIWSTSCRFSSCKNRSRECISEIVYEVDCICWVCSLRDRNVAPVAAFSKLPHWKFCTLYIN